MDRRYAEAGKEDIRIGRLAEEPAGWWKAGSICQQVAFDDRDPKIRGEGTPALQSITCFYLLVHSE